MEEKYFNPLCSVLLTLGTVFFTVINSLGDILYNAGMETESSVVEIVESYSEFMYGMCKKGMYLLIVFL